MIQIPLKEVNELFTCFLCHGYYQQANTLPDCLHTFCRICIVRYVLAHSHSSNIRCPRCETDLGTYSQVTKKVKHDRSLQVICDALFPPPGSDSLHAGLRPGSSLHEKDVKGDDQDGVDGEEGDEEGKELTEDKKGRQKSKTAKTSIVTALINEVKKPVPLPPKSLQNILGHKLLTTELMFQSKESSILESKKRKHVELQTAPTTANTPAISTSEVSGDPLAKRVKSNSDDENWVSIPTAVKKIKPTKSQREQANELLGSIFDNNFTQSVPSSNAVSSATAENLQLPLSLPEQGKEPQVKLLRETKVDAALRLPELPKPTFRSQLDVKVQRVQNFVHKRLPEDVKGSINANDIEVLYRGTSILNHNDLSAFQSELGADRCLTLTYHRKA